MSDVLDPDAARQGVARTSETAKLVPALLSISKSTRALVGIKLTELGFYNGQDELVLALDKKAEISVSKLADELCVRPSTVSKMLDRLVASGMAERSASKQDGRQTMVRITAAGLDARSRLLDMREKLEAELVSSFPGNTVSMTKALADVSAILKTRLARIR